MTAETLTPDARRLLRPLGLLAMGAPAAILLAWTSGVATWLLWFRLTSDYCRQAACTVAVPDEQWDAAESAVTAAGGDITGWLGPGYFPQLFLVLLLALPLSSGATIMALSPDERALWSARADRRVAWALGGLTITTLVLLLVSFPTLAWFSHVTE